MKSMVQKIFVFFLAVGLLTASDLYAAQFKIDPGYSQASLKIKLPRGTWAARVDAVSGGIKLDDNNTVLVGLDGNLDMTRAFNRRGEDLSPQRVLETDKFPKAKMGSTKVEKDQILIDLTLHGVTKTVAFQYVFRGLAQDEHGQMRTALALRAKLNRKDFGLTYNVQDEDGKPLLGDEIEILIDLQGVLIGSPARNH